MFYIKNISLLIILIFIIIPNNSYQKNYKKNKINPEITTEGLIFYYQDQYAKNIYLKSSLDKWTLKFPFSKQINKRGIWTGLWKLIMPIKYKIFQLNKGIYKYKFIVDGEYTIDPLNPNKLQDTLGGFVSFFTLKKNLINYNIDKNPTLVKNNKNYYRFIYKSFIAKEVNLLGNFNHWNPYSHPLKYKGKGFWEIKINLTRGKYYYNFIVDQKWVSDPLNINRVKNVLNKTFSYFELT